MKLTLFRCDMCGTPASQLAGWSEHHVFHFDAEGEPKHVGNVHTCPECRLPAPATQPEPRLCQGGSIGYPGTLRCDGCRRCDPEHFGRLQDVRT